MDPPKETTCALDLSTGEIRRHLVIIWWYFGDTQWCLEIESNIKYRGFLSHRATPSHHPDFHCMFPNKNHPWLGDYDIATLPSSRLTVAVMELMKDEKTPMAKRMTQTAKSLAEWTLDANVLGDFWCECPYNIDRYIYHILANTYIYINDIIWYVYMNVGGEWMAMIIFSHLYNEFVKQRVTINHEEAKRWFDKIVDSSQPSKHTILWCAKIGYPFHGVQETRYKLVLRSFRLINDTI